MKREKRKNENNTPLQMNGQELQFPVTYHLKAVMEQGNGDAGNKKALTGVFENLKIGYLYHSKNKSSRGTYVSYTYEVTLKDRETMQKLYILLKEIDNLKFAL